MVVDHTHSLQERINDRGTDEAHAPALQVLGDTVRQLCVGARFIIRIQDDFTTIRRLTPLECERLQGFPDGWTDLPGASDSARYKALGNSVAIPCVEFIMWGICAAVLYG